MFEEPPIYYIPHQPHLPDRLRSNQLRHLACVADERRILRQTGRHGDRVSPLCNDSHSLHDLGGLIC